MSSGDQNTASRPPRSRWGRLIAWVGLPVIVVAIFIYLGLTALSARHQINLIQAQLGPLKSDLEAGQTTEASPLIASIKSESDHAHNDTTGPLWWVAAKLPWVGRPAAVVRGGSTAVHEVAAGALPAISTAATQLSPSTLRHGSTINLARFTAAQPSLTVAAASLDKARRRADGLPTSTWLSAATTSRNTLVSKLDSLDKTVDTLTQAALHLPQLLGATGEQRYLVIFENEAESRGLGGLPGAYAILTADHGSLHFTHFGTDADLEGASAPNVHLAKNLVPLYSDGLFITSQFLSATLSPNFPTDAPILSAMAQQRLHIKFTGVLATDPTALADVLSTTGPLRVDGKKLTSTNLVSELEQQAYAQFGAAPTQNQQRKSLLVDAAKSAAHALLSGTGSLSSLATTLQGAVDQRRLLAYSSSATSQRWLSGTALGGAIPVTTRPFSAFAIDNGSGTKLDYYLHRTVSYQRFTCAASETLTKITLRNDVPRGPLPLYVSQHAVMPNEPVGFNQLLVYLYATQGSTISAVTIDGKSVTFNSGVEAGHPVAIIQISMNPRESYTIGLYAHEPAATGQLVRMVQPLVVPEVDKTDMPDCS